MQSDTGVLPLRGNTVHEILDNDHSVIKSLLDDLTRATERTERQRILEQLKGCLTIHNAMEENLVYPALDKIAGHMMESQKLYHQTASADVLVFECDTMLKEGEDREFQQKAEKLHDAVFSHIKAEDDGAVPHLKKGSETKEAQMLLQSIREFRSAIRFMPAGAVPHVETGEVRTAPATTRVT